MIKQTEHQQNAYNQNERYILTTSCTVGTSHRLRAFGASLLSVWPANGSRNEAGFSRFAAIFILQYELLRMSKDRLENPISVQHFPTIPKHSQTICIRLIPPTSTYIILHPLKSNIPTKQPQCQECPQVAHSLTQSP